MIFYIQNLWRPSNKELVVKKFISNGSDIKEQKWLYSLYNLITRELNPNMGVVVSQLSSLGAFMEFTDGENK